MSTYAAGSAPIGGVGVVDEDTTMKGKKAIDGVARKGKTKGKQIVMAKGGKVGKC